MSDIEEAASKFGAMGGNATKKKYGREHYSRIASERNKKYWASRKKAKNGKSD